MHAESHHGPLPLADAIIEWSEPALVEAIRAEEAKFPQGKLEELDHYTLVDVRTLRRLPDRLSMAILSHGVTAALDRAWERLFAAFRHRIERGEFWLEGTQTISFGKPGPVPLPREQATQFDFDPPAGAVKIGIRTYVGVTVRRIAAGAADTTPQQPVGRRELSLRDAYREWRDADLCARIHKLELLVTGLSHVVPQEDEGNLTPEQRARRAVTIIDLADPRTALTAARKALLDDFRGRIESGEFELAGVQTFPLRESERKAIPGLWAADFWFDFDNNKISVVQNNHTSHIYNAVMVSGPPPPSIVSTLVSGLPTSVPFQGGAGQQASELAAASVSGPSRQHAARTVTTRGRSGRKDSRPVIEAAVRAHWEYIRPPESDPDRAVVWAEKARTLRKRMRVAATKGGPMDLLEVNTIRKHLPDIYRGVLTEKEATAKSDQ